MGPVRSYLNDAGLESDDFPVSREKLAGLINLVDDGKVNYSMASQTVFPALLRSDRLPQSLIEELGEALDNSSDLLEGYINAVIIRFPDKVKHYKSGKTGLRSEERRVGKEWVSTCRSWGWRFDLKKKY